jgi:hypothetical protein
MEVKSFGLEGPAEHASETKGEHAARIESKAHRAAALMPARNRSLQQGAEMIAVARDDLDAAETLHFLVAMPQFPHAATPT